MIEFRLPSLGSDMDQGKLLQWNVAPGQAVKKGTAAHCSWPGCATCCSSSSYFEPGNT